MSASSPSLESISSVEMSTPTNEINRDNIGKMSIDEYTRTIDAIEEIRNKVGSGELELPQICVIGNQSSGKSSLLGKLVDGLDRVLPQGSGTVTRCPIVIRTRKLRDKSIKSSVNINGEEFDWDMHGQVQANGKVVELQQLRINGASDSSSAAGNGILGFSDEEIHITVSHHDVNDLVLVDLPGLISNATEDKVAKVENMVKKYIEKETSFILVVHIADVDIENAKACKLAKDVDPDGERTLVVFSKCDNFSSKSNEKSFEDKMQYAGSYHGVCCNKAGNDDDSRLIGKQASEVEMEMDYHTKFPDNFGVSRLLNDRLPPILANILKKNIPRLEDQIRKKQEEAKNILKEIHHDDSNADEVAIGIQQALNHSKGKLYEKISVIIKDLSSNMNDFGTKHIKEAVYINRIKSNIFHHSSYQGSEEFEEDIKNIAHRVISYVPNKIENIFDAIFDMLKDVSGKNEKIFRGLKTLWSAYRMKLDDIIRDELMRLEEEMAEYNCIQDISGGVYAITGQPPPKSTFAPDADGKHFQNLKSYFNEMAATLVKRVLAITQIIIIKRHFVQFTNHLSRDIQFREHCEEDQKVKAKRRESKEHLIKMQQCLAILRSL